MPVFSHVMLQFFDHGVVDEPRSLPDQLGFDRGWHRINALLRDRWLLKLQRHTP